MSEKANKKIRRVPFTINVKKKSSLIKVKRIPKTEIIPENFIIEASKQLRFNVENVPIIYVKPNEDEINAWLSTCAGYAQGFFQYDGKPVLLEDYQESWIEDNSKFRAGVKSRRIGFSFAEAIKILSRAMLITTNHTTTIISYTLEEAISKIDYCRALYDSAPDGYKKKKIRDRRQSLEFLDPKTGTVQKIVSHAQKGPRGSGGSIFLDEYAWFIWAYMIMEAALACILTGDGDITVVSTPNGDGDPFHEIISDQQKYWNYTRHFIYWWDCRWLCNNVKEARKYAHLMSTQERVYRYGSSLLKQVYDGYLDEESFQQEMELLFRSSSYRYISKDLVMQCVFPYSSQVCIGPGGTIITNDSASFNTEDDAGIDIAAKSWKDASGNEHKSAYPIINIYAGDPKIDFFKCNSLEELAQLINSGVINKYNLYAGYDVGRSVHVSDLRILEGVEASDGEIVLIERYSEQLKNTPLPDQEHYLIGVMDMLMSLNLAIDIGGIGRGIGEKLERLYPDRVRLITFTVEWKQDAAKMLRSRFEKHRIAIAEDRVIIAHITSIKRNITANLNEIFTADFKKEKHHGDAFWSLAMASYIAPPIEDVKGRPFDTATARLANSRMFQANLQRMMAGHVGNPRNVIPISSMIGNPAQSQFALAGLPHPSLICGPEGANSIIDISSRLPFRHGMGRR